MKFYTRLTLILIVVLILSFTVTGSCNNMYVPYGPDMMQTNRFENFHSGKGASLDYTTATGVSSEMDSARMPSAGCKKVTGFQGIYCDANQTPSNPVDIYSQAQGSPNCASMGYSNSRGFLCMNEEQKRLLTSRGGNASGM